MRSQPYQGFGLLLIFVIEELVPAQHEPAAVPSLDKTSLLPEPPTPDDIWPSLLLNVCAGLTSAALGAAVGHALVVHYSQTALICKQANSLNLFRFTEAARS